MSKSLAFLAAGVLGLTLCQATNVGANEPQPPNAPPQLVDDIKAKKLIVSAVYGGPGGDNSYCYYLPPGVRFTNIKIAWWSAIDGLDFTTSDKSHFTIGTFGGTGNHPEELHLESIDLKEGERIISIEVQKGGVNRPEVITGITFHISGRDAFHYGAPVTQTLGVPDGYEIIGFWGRCGALVDSLGTIARKS